MAERRVRSDMMAPTRRLVLGGMAGALAWPAMAARAPEGDWVPFDDSDGLIRFQGAVNDHPVLLTLDSGAGRVVIDQTFARKIGLEAVDTQGTLHGLIGSRPGGLSGPLDIHVGSGDLRLPNAVLADLSVLNVGGFDAPALIGRDIFELVSVDIDFLGKRIAFREPGTFDTSEFRRVRMRPQKDVRQIEISIEGKKPVWATVDLGSGSALDIAKAYATSLGLFDGRRTSAWPSAGIDGIDVHEVARASHVRIAGATLHDVSFHAYPVWNQAATAPANIGYPLLRRLGRIILDYQSDALFVPKNTTPLPSPGDDPTGLALIALASGYEVAFVAPGSPADKGGWKAGERIAAINGRATMSKGERSAAGASARIVYTMADGSVRELVPVEYY